MRVVSPLIVFLFLGLVCCPVLGQEYLTKQVTILVPIENLKLSTSGKDALSASVGQEKPEDSVSLEPDTRVRLVNRSRFLARETVYDRENSTSTTVNRLFKAALVEVLTGDSKGTKGWVVVSYRDTGGDPNVFLAQAPLRVEKGSAEHP